VVPMLASLAGVFASHVGWCVTQKLKSQAQQLEDDRTATDEVERQKRALVARLESVKQAQTVRNGHWTAGWCFDRDLTGPAARQDVDGVIKQAGEVDVEYKKYKDVVRDVRSQQQAIEQCDSEVSAMEAQKKV